MGYHWQNGFEVWIKMSSEFPNEKVFVLFFRDHHYSACTKACRVPCTRSMILLRSPLTNDIYLEPQAPMSLCY